LTEVTVASFTVIRNKSVVTVQKAFQTKMPHHHLPLLYQDWTHRPCMHRNWKKHHRRPKPQGQEYKQRDRVTTHWLWLWLWKYPRRTNTKRTTRTHHGERRRQRTTGQRTPTRQHQHRRRNKRNTAYKNMKKRPRQTSSDEQDRKQPDQRRPRTTYKPNISQARKKPNTTE